MTLLFAFSKEYMIERIVGNIRSDYIEKADTEGNKMWVIAVHPVRCVFGCFIFSLWVDSNILYACIAIY